MILLFLDIIKNEGDSSPHYLWEFFLAVLSASVVITGILFEKHLERKKEDNHKVTGVKVLSSLLNKIVVSLTANTIHIESEIKKVSDNNFGILNVNDFNYSEIDLIKTITPQDLYIGYLTLYKDIESSGVQNYSSVLNTVAIVDVETKRLKEINGKYIEEIDKLSMELQLKFREIKATFLTTFVNNSLDEFDAQLYSDYIALNENYTKILATRKNLNHPILQIRFEDFIVPLNSILEENSTSSYFGGLYLLLNQYESVNDRFEAANENYYSSLLESLHNLNKYKNDLTNLCGDLNHHLFKFKYSTTELNMLLRPKYWTKRLTFYLINQRMKWSNNQ